MGLRNPRERVTLWIRSRQPAALLYGAIITGAVMSATAGHETSVRRIVATTLFVLGIYWLADVYVHAFAQQFSRGRQALKHRLSSAARHESGVLLGGIPALAAFILAAVAGAPAGTAADVALWVTVVGLAALAYLAARYAGSPLREAALESAFAALLGVVMVVAKSLLH